MKGARWFPAFVVWRNGRKKVESGNNSNWLNFHCHQCNSPAIPTNGTYFWCPKCGFVPKVNGHKNNTVF